MLSDAFLKALKPVPPRDLVKMNLFLGYLRRHEDEQSSRARDITPNGNGSRLLLAIMKSIDLPWLINLDLSVALNKLVDLEPRLSSIIDVRTGKHTPRSLFIHSKTWCYELMTPSSRRSPLIDIPINQPYTHPRWQSLRPLRIADMGTCDLRFQLYNDRLSFSHRGPTHAIYTLDCVALVAQFLAYYKSLSKVADLDQCLLEFLHNEIIVPALLHDTTALWLRNTYKQQLMTQSPLESLTMTMWDATVPDTLGSDFTGAMQDVQHLKTDVLQGSVGFQTALSSLPLTVYKQPFTHYYTHLVHTTRLPSGDASVWVECLKNIAWWEFIILVVSLYPNRPDAVSFFRTVTRDVGLARMMKPWNMISQSIALSSIMETRLNGIYYFLSQYR